MAASRTSPLISSRETRSPSHFASTWIVPPGWATSRAASARRSWASYAPSAAVPLPQPRSHTLLPVERT